MFHGANDLPFGNDQINQIFGRANELKKNMTQNPQQIVQQMLNSGQMTQEQFNKLAQMTDRIMRMRR